MRYLLTSILLCLFMTSTSFAQSSCCASNASPTLAFAGFSNQAAFIAGHLPPEPLNYEPKIGKMVSLKTDDGKEVAIFEVKSGQSMGKVILLFHEWWGLNDYIKREAEELFMQTGATVIAMDLYEGKVTANPEEAAKLMQSVKEERARSIIRAGIEYAGKFGKVQTIGWCMGGGWSLQASILAGEKGYGCVIYYGMPENDPAKLQQLAGPVLGIYGKQDAWITPALVDFFDKNMKANQKAFTFYMYEADHAFANPSNPKYNKEATAKARTLVVEFLKKNFETPLRKPAPGDAKQE